MPGPLLLTHPSSLEHDPRAFMPSHPDTPERLLAIEELLGPEDWLGWDRREAPPADEAWLELVHEPAYVARIRELSAAGGGRVDPDTAIGEASYGAALHAAGGACELVRALLDDEISRGLSCMRPSGHHAEADRAMGFCLFNNVAIAAELAVRELGAERVLILDWDVHHGNGTEAAFRAREDVLFVSLHEAGIYPGTGALYEVGVGAGEGYTINLPVPGRSEEELWLSLLSHIVVPVARSFEPELVLISAGFDAHRADPLATCLLESSSFGELARHVRALATACEVPLGVVLEGGYEPLALAQSLRETLLALTDERPPREVGAEHELTALATSELRPYWPL